MSSPSDGKKMKRTDTNPGSKNNTELHRTTSSTRAPSPMA